MQGARLDVSGTVDLSDAEAVMAEVRRIMVSVWPDGDWAGLAPLTELFCALYAGEHPDYRGCEVGYHDADHVLAVTLAMARLLAGCERRWGPSISPGPELALAGIAGALLHDSGYLRRRTDRRRQTGAAYTRTHVKRSAALAREQLPALGLGELAPLSARLIHFTNCARDPATVRIGGPLERALGGMLGTADLIAQISATDYLEKCRFQLYDEFEVSGFTGKSGSTYIAGPTYLSRDDLMERTPAFIHQVAGARMERDFHGAYHYAAIFFGGSDPYLDGIAANCARLEAALDNGR